jgi:hypothetical protein
MIGQHPFEQMLTGQQGLKALYCLQQMVAQHLWQQLWQHQAEADELARLRPTRLKMAKR